jgi:hypothetical protein
MKFMGLRGAILLDGLSENPLLIGSGIQLCKISLMCCDRWRCFAFVHTVSNLENSMAVFS